MGKIPFKNGCGLNKIHAFSLFAFLFSFLSVCLASVSYGQSSLPIISPLEEEVVTETEADDFSLEESEAGTGPLIEQIIVRGAERISPATIVDYLTFSAGDKYSISKVNTSIKKIYATGLFADAAIKREGSKVIVTVRENPVINRLAFEGNERIDDNILEAEVRLPSRSVYSREKVAEATQRILDIYRRRGRFAVMVNPQIIQQDQNRIDLIFEITEGELASVKEIFFIGNEFFTDDDLSEAISSKEYAWYRFLSSDDTYDPDRVKYDEELLRQHYAEYGFMDYRLVSSVAELLEDRSGFYITFALEEGTRYRIGDIKITSDIDEVTPEMVQEMVTIKSGEWYSQLDADNIANNIVDLLSQKGYAFSDVEVLRKSDDNSDVLDVHFHIKEGQRVYVERINISGNVRTIDSVLRREFELVEGDPYNKTKVNLTRRNLQKLGYFSTVKLDNKPGSANDRSILDVKVEETSTGAINFGAGYSTTDKGLFTISLSERNLLGEGKKVNLVYAQSGRTEDFTFDYTEPYFLDYDLDAGIGLFSNTVSQSESSYESRDKGVRLSASYSLTNYLFHSVFYKFSDQDIKGISSSSAILKAQEGQNIISSVGHVLAYDKRNSVIEPTAGHYVKLGNTFAWLGGDIHYLRTTLTGAYYYSPLKDTTLILGGETGVNIGINGDEVRVSDRFFLGGDNLRGFEVAGVGPRDSSTTDALGGTYMANATAEMRFPLGLPDDFGVKGAVFSDAGYLAGIEDDKKISSKAIDDKKLRASAGAGLAVKTPIGPMRFDFAWPLLEQSYDKTQVFRFTFKARF